MLLFFLSFWVFVSVDKSHAQEDTNMVPSPTPQVQNTVEYELPYPGLLPDNPLYFLKVIRDRVVSFLISDPKKKAEFNLLQADKRLNAGLYLFNSAKSGTVQNPTKENEKKINLAISTISKAENYFFEAILEINKAKTQGIDITNLAGRLLTSSEKHQEIIISLEKRSKGNIKESLMGERKRTESFEKQVREILLGK